MRTWLRTLPGSAKQRTASRKIRRHRVFESLEDRTVLSADISGITLAQTSPAAPAHVVPGQLITYTITVPNAAAATTTTTHVNVGYRVPSGETVVGATASQTAAGSSVDIDGVSDAVSADLGAIAPGANATLTVTALIDASASSPLIGFANVWSPEDATFNTAANATDSNQVSTTVDPVPAAAPNVSVAMTGPSLANLGAQITYTVTLNNSSAANAATNVAFIDRLDPNESFVSATDTAGSNFSFDAATGQITGTVANIGTSSSDTVTVVATSTNAAKATGSVTNYALVSIPSGNAGSPSSASLTTSFPADISGITVAQTSPAAPAHVVPGQLITYTITVPNAAAAAGSTADVNVTDVLPAGETLVTATAGSQASPISVTIDRATNTVTTDLGTIAPGAQQTLTITALVTAGAGPTLNNSATVWSPQDGVFNSAANQKTSNTVSTTVDAVSQGAANVSIAQTGPASGIGGSLVTYTVTLTNNNAANPATNVAFIDQLDPGAALFSVSDTAGTALTYDSTTEQVTGTVANIAKSGTDTVTLVVVATGASVTSTAFVSIPSGNLATTTSASVTTSVTAGASPANVALDIGEPTIKTYVGDVMEFDSEVFNQVNTAASNVSFAFQLDPNQVLLSVSDQDNTSFSLVNGVISGTIASLPANHGERITILVSPTSAAGTAGSVTNSAVIAAPGGINSGVITDAATTPINTPGGANVTVTKTGPATGVVGGPVTYTVKLANTGFAAAANVQVGDLLEPNQTLLSATDTEGTAFSLTNGEVTGRVASIPAGVTDTVTIVTVPTAAGTLSNTVYTGVPGGNQADNVSSPAVTTTVSTPPANAPAISVTKSGPASANVGDLITYTVKVSNSGGPAANVQFSDTLSSNLTVFSVSDSAGSSFSVANGLISTTIASIPSGSSDTITIVAIPTEFGTATDPITVAVPGGNTGTITTTPNSTTINMATSGADVDINKSPPAASVAIGDKLTSTVAVTNNTSGTAVTNVAFVDSFPGQAFFSASDTNGTVFTFNSSTDELTGTIASIAGGATDTITIVTVPTAVTTNTDTATIGISGGNQAPNMSTATATVTAIPPVPIPGVGVTKTGPATGTVGSPISDTITLSNGSGLAVPGSVAFVDTVGTNVSNVTASDGQAGDTFTYNPATGQVTGTVSSAAFSGTVGGLFGGTATVTVTFTPKAAGSLTDTATIAIPGGNQGGPVSATFTTAVATPPSLSISKTGTPSTISVGDTETYTITISNTGGTAATGAVVTDVVPAGLTNVHATDAAGTVTISGNTVTDNLGTVAANTGTETLTITATAAALPSGTRFTTVTNTANLAFGGTTTPSNSVTTTIATPPSLSITKVGTPETAVVGGTVTYLITLTNSGGTAATGAVVTDVVPAGLTNVQATDPTGTVTINGNTVTDHFAPVPVFGPPATSTETLTITATAAALPSGTTSTTVTNTASVAFGGTNTTSNAVTTTINAVTPITSGIGFLAGQPGDGTAQTFVQNLYRELLGREADSAGQTFWVDYLTQHNNAAGQKQVVQGFLNSHEYAVHYVTTIYEVILDRAADAAGLQYWTSKMGTPGTPAQNSGSSDEKGIVAAFFGSDEFYLKSGDTPQSWINALYEDILGRAPDGSGAAFWANELTTRGADDRDGIVSDLLTTPEAAHFELDSFYPATGGTSSHPLPAPGTAAGTGSTELATITGDGWENLYLQGPYGSQPEGNDSFFNSLAAGAAWDDVQLLLLETGQFYTNPNRPITN